MENERKIRLALLVLVIGLAPGAFAQSNTGAYWVIEGNIHKPTYTLIHYYNAKHQLIRDEKLEGKYLDITKRRHVKFLNKKLQRLTDIKVETKRESRSSFTGHHKNRKYSAAVPAGS